MTTLYIVRHGEYENPEYLFPGRLPGYPLSEAGRKQAVRLADYLADKNIQALYSSPLRRIRETAKILSERLHIPITFDLRLIEIRTELDGTSMKKFDETNGQLSYLPEYVARGAEPMEAAADRMYRALEDIRSQNGGSTILVVTHGDPMRFALMKYLGTPMDFAKSRALKTPLAGGYRLEIGGKGKTMAEILPVGT